MNRSRRVPAYVPLSPSAIYSHQASAVCVSPKRVGLSEATYSHLKTLAAKRFRGGGTTSKMGNVILDNYLAHIERAYFGRARVLACTAVPKGERDIDAVIFDMDGVLCDSESISRLVGTLVFERLYDTLVTVDDFAPFTGTGEGNFLAGVAKQYRVVGFDVEEAKQKFFEIYLEGGLSQELRAFPGVANLVERVKQLGLKAAVASAADAVKVERNLKAIGLPKPTFDFVTSSDDIERKKPAPDVFLAAARGLGVEPGRCVVVEDAVAGVKAARSAGMRCVAVSTSLSAKLLSKAGAHVVRDEPAFIEVIDLFGRDVFAEMEQGSQNQQQEQA